MCGDPGGIGGGATGEGGMHGFAANDAAVGIGGGVGGNVGRDAVFQGATGHNTVNPDTPSGDVGVMGSAADFSGINSEISRAMDTSPPSAAVILDHDALNAIVEAELGRSGLNDGTDQATVQDAILAAQQAEPSQALETFLSVAGKIIGTGGSVVFGRAFDALVEGLQALGLSAKSAAAAITGLFNGASASDVAGSIGPGDMGGPGDFPAPVAGGAGGPAGTTGGGSTGGTEENMTGDPTSYGFWDEFVNEWMTAKDKYMEDDAFKKSKVEPAIGKYQAMLADLTDQAKNGTGTYSPVTFGMGDFRTSFVPKSGFLAAEDIKNYGKEDLTSELALTDVMQPNKGSLEYLDKLKKLGVWQYEQGQAAQLAREGNATYLEGKTWEPDDKGTWLDTIKDIVQIGDTVGDAIGRYW